MEAETSILGMITIVAFMLKFKKDGIFSFLDPLFYLSVWSTLYIFLGAALNYGPSLGLNLESALTFQKWILCFFYQISFLFFMVFLPSGMSKFRKIAFSEFPRMSVHFGVFLWAIAALYMIGLTLTQWDKILELPANRVVRYDFYLDYLCGRFNFSLAQQGLSFLAAFLSLRFRNRVFFLALIFPAIMMFLLGNRMEFFYIIMWYFLTTLILKRKFPLFIPCFAIFCILIIGLVREKTGGFADSLMSGNNKLLDAVKYIALEFGYNNASIDVALTNSNKIDVVGNAAYAIVISATSLVIPQALGWVPLANEFLGFTADKLTDFYAIGFSLSQNILSEALLFGKSFSFLAPLVIIAYFTFIKKLCSSLGAFGLLFLLQMCIYSWLLFRGSGFLFLGKYVSMLWHYYFWILIPLFFAGAYKYRFRNLRTDN